MPARKAPRSALTFGLLAASCVLLIPLLLLIPRAPVASPPAVDEGPGDVVESGSGAESEPETERTSAVAARRASREPAVEGRKVVGRLAIIIDDAGQSLEDLEPFLALPQELTIAVLPGLPQSTESARRARAAGKEVLLHVPMEPVGDENPGPGALRVGMPGAAIRAELERALAEVGPVAGANNHMGSRATADRALVQAVLSVMKEKGLYVVDSKTTSSSVVESEARALGVRAAARDVFLDNEATSAAMRLRLEETREIASGRGWAIAIGHAHSAELAGLLREELPRLEREGYRMVRVGEVARVGGGAR